MTAARKHRLADCAPRWLDFAAYTGQPDGVKCGLVFDCPEGHPGCQIAIPFTPALDGRAVASWQSNGALWRRTGDTFETLTLEPSIRREPSPRDACAVHFFVRDGAIQFCGDSR